MKVSELIGILQRMPQDAEVWHVWDGEPRTAIAYVWETVDGRVLTADHEQVCYAMDDFPKQIKDQCWRDGRSPPERWMTPSNARES